MPPANPAPTPPNPAPAPTPPAPAPAPAPAPIDVNPQPAFTLPGGPPAPATPPAAPAPEEPPAWAKDFIQKNEERWNALDAVLNDDGTGGGQPPAPGAPIGAPAPGAPAPASELAARNPQSWADVENFVNEKVQEARTGAANDIRTQAQKEADDQAAAEAKVNQELDAAVDNLQSQGLLPAIANPGDSNDPGRVYRRELYGMAAKLGTTDLQNVAQMVLKPLHERGQLYDPISDSYINYSQPVPGAAAPIGSSTQSTGASPGGPSYEQIHKARSFSELRSRAGL